MSGVYQTIAEANPITWMIDGMRHQVVVGLRPRGGRDLDRASGRDSAALSICGAHRALRARLRPRMTQRLRVA